MDTAELLAHFDAEHEAFLAACEAAGPTATVPACPGWTVADLQYHMYEVQYGWNRVTTERRQGFEGLNWPARPADEHLAVLLRGEHAGYEAMLRSFPADTRIWTWAGEHDFAWLVRRMAQEIAVHRVDAQQATGAATPIDAALASGHPLIVGSSKTWDAWGKAQSAAGDYLNYRNPGGHYVTILGKTADGQYIVADPLSKTGARAVSAEQVKTLLSGAWDAIEVSRK